MLLFRTALPSRPDAVFVAVLLVAMFIAMAGLADSALAANPWVDRP